MRGVDRNGERGRERERGGGLKGERFWAGKGRGEGGRERERTHGERIDEFG